MCFTSGHPKLAFFLPLGLLSVGKHGKTSMGLFILRVCYKSMICVSHKLRRSFNSSFLLAEPGWSWTSPLLIYLSTAKEITEVLSVGHSFGTKSQPHIGSGQQWHAQEAGFEIFHQAFFLVHTSLFWLKAVNCVIMGWTLPGIVWYFFSVALLR